MRKCSLAAPLCSALRADPEKILKYAYGPNIYGMHPSAIAVVEITYLDDAVNPSVIIEGKTVIGKDSQNSREIAFRALLRNGKITPLPDNSIGA